MHMPICKPVDDGHLWIWIYPWISTENLWVWIWIWMNNFISTASLLVEEGNSGKCFPYCEARVMAVRVRMNEVCRKYTRSGGLHTNWIIDERLSDVKSTD